MATGLLEKEAAKAPGVASATEPIFLKAEIIDAIDVNGGRYTSKIVADIGRLPDNLRNEVVAYVGRTYPTDRFPETSMHNTRLILEMLQSRMADRKSRRTDYSN